MRNSRRNGSLSVVREFHVSRASRDKYAFDQALYTLRGNVIFADFHSARLFAQKINAQRDLLHFPELAVRAADLNAAALLEEILHYVVAQYRQTLAPDVLQQALAFLNESLDPETVETVLKTYTEHFPTLAVYRDGLDIEIYLSGETEGEANREIMLEELLMLWLANVNPAVIPFIELFDDENLTVDSAYGDVVGHLYDFFDTQPPFGPRNENLIDMLRAPAKAAPDSLESQLAYIRSNWGFLVGKYLERLLRGLDFIAEENKVFFGFGPGPAKILTYDDMGDAPENFSVDLEWMPNVVMLAKNAYVWLNQLAKQYDQPIERLDQVPDEELDILRHRGITALWLIGLWERSDASRRIKQMMGNPDAVASAYSLKRYTIANDLGGEAAFENLRQRAWQRGIRMASDMVPNHTGIDSDWMIEHPDWFISLDYSPFPNYSFNGADLCDDERVGVYLDDHYYTHSDAAVVMKRVDHLTGDTKYIYHGNDGTMMPWNDTAQLNYLLPEVREAAIQTILDVARRSPIIRFDAAMTLTRQHFQRLWFPEPGTGGDIASRADHGMTKADFNEAMPVEFWQEVVTRIAEEVPDTLLLAEAFWMMEGYFVRTLGMHRVYNSAFMIMLRDEKNAEYRKLIKNTLEYDPQILKRYVNFMNNPDERTAIDQFGDGDKYFGVCTLMMTMPGLPMVGHGQVEGYSEKYGMEYRRAYWDEVPNAHLVGRHEQQIFPLAHKRYLFAEVENFSLYDFYTASGGVDENVFAYSNRVGQEQALVLYHNRYAETKGWLKASSAYLAKEGDDAHLRQRTLGEGLQIPNDAATFVIFRDLVTGLQFVRNCGDIHERGMYIELHAYQTQVFLDFYAVNDNSAHHYSRVCERLNGKGVPNIEHAIKEMYLEPVYMPFRMLVSALAFKWLRKHAVVALSDEINPRMLEQVEEKVTDLLTAVASYADKVVPVERETETVVQMLGAVLKFKAWLSSTDDVARQCRPAAAYLLDGLDSEGWQTWAPLLSWVFVRGMSHITQDDLLRDSRAWYDEWLLNKIVGETLFELGSPRHEAERLSTLVGLLLDFNAWAIDDLDDLPTANQLVQRMLSMPETLAYLGVNRYQGILWFNQQAFKSLLWWVQCIATLQLWAAQPKGWERSVANLYRSMQRLLIAESVSDYQVDKLLENLGE